MGVVDHVEDMIRGLVDHGRGEVIEMGWSDRDPYLSSQAWKTLRASLKRQWEVQQIPCARCGRTIGYDLAFPHPASFALGHKVSRAKYARHGVTDVSVVHGVSNLQPEHLHCSTRSGVVEGNRSVARQDQYGARSWSGIGTSREPTAPSTVKGGRSGGGWRAYGEYAETLEELYQLIDDVKSGKIIPRWPR
jgi:hypothetical protein